MLLAVLSGFALALIAPWVQQLGSGRGVWVLSLLPLGLFLFFGHHLLALDAHAVYTVTYDWIPSLGIRLSFYADGLSLLLALLISGIGTLVVVYAGVYLGDHPHRGRPRSWCWSASSACCWAPSRSSWRPSVRA
jgi:multicomponent Na+:H+ antiporter subunit A